ncbi:MAG: flagella basal body P-ring formation protein FlgA [Candidatus Obscuribacter sp.]|nr:flagella basal body P-ring formation protein FlgA [Candidatus Melainabacteria bacterium]MDX1989540.1 flagella basal body P-ring formation protein FlgA [Candidatus Obscuribacter sp.]
MVGCGLQEDPKAPAVNIVYATSDLNKGDPVTEEDVELKALHIVKPPQGALTSLEQIDLKCAKRAVMMGEILKAEDLEDLSEPQIKVEISEKLARQVEKLAAAEHKTLEEYTVQLLKTDLLSSKNAEPRQKSNGKKKGSEK